MTIQLSPEQQRWLEAQVAAGHFASLTSRADCSCDDRRRLLQLKERAHEIADGSLRGGSQKG